MPSLKSTPRRIVTNFFFGLNAACKPPRRPHSNTLPTSLQFSSRIPAIPLTPPAIPSRPEGAEAPSPGHRPGYSCPHAWRPVGAKALYGAPNLRLCFSIHPRTGYGILLIMLKCSLLGDKIFLALFGLTDFGLYICTKISDLWIKVYIQNYTNA